MKYTTFRPPEHLKEYIRFFWVLEDDGKGYVHRSMADVSTEMIFHYNNLFDEHCSNGKIEKSFYAGAQGPSDKIRRFSIDKAFGIFGVYLYPYTLPLISRTACTEFVNQMPELGALFGREGSELEEQVITAKDNRQRIRIMTNFFDRKINECQIKENRILPAIRFVLEGNGLQRINDLYEHFSLSKRQFERKFKTFSGFTPKRVSRIVRFQSTMKNFGNSSKSLTDIAYECGYFDQSHFIHEFKQFSGYHPKAYFFGNPEGTEWRES